MGCFKDGVISSLTGRRFHAFARIFNPNVGHLEIHLKLFSHTAAKTSPFVGIRADCMMHMHSLKCLDRTVFLILQNTEGF